jgi:diguanylate cyclase (GGDEF)-like protein
LIDIDNFKSINDTYGHRIGDIVLARVADVIRTSLAPSDVGSRYGGEEFALLLFEQTLEEAYRLVEKIRQRISTISHEELAGDHVTVSIGLRSYEYALSKETLFELVDAHLYQAKHQGKNQTVSPLSATRP